MTVLSTPEAGVIPPEDGGSAVPEGPSVQVNSEEFGRVLNNVLAHVPARSNILVIHVEVDEDIVRAWGTDTYTAGYDWCSAVAQPTWLLPAGMPEAFDLTREDAQAIEKAARMDRKGHGLIVLHDGQVTFQPNSQEPPVTATPDWSNPHAEVWTTVEAMVAEPGTFRTAFQPELLQRFAKVKADKAERVADLAIEDPSEPVIIKIGPTFRGLIMPVDRPAHSELIGEEGLF